MNSLPGESTFLEEDSLKAVFLSLALLLAVETTHASYGMNACYAVVQGGSSTTIVCLAHVGEESLDGSGAYLGVFLPYDGDRIRQCWNTKTIVRSATEYAFAKTHEIIRFRFEDTTFERAKVEMLNPDGTYSEAVATRFPDQRLLQSKRDQLTERNCR